MSPVYGHCSGPSYCMTAIMPGSMGVSVAAVMMVLVIIVVSSIS